MFGVSHSFALQPLAVTVYESPIVRTPTSKSYSCWEKDFSGNMCTPLEASAHDDHGDGISFKGFARAKPNTFNSLSHDARYDAVKRSQIFTSARCVWMAFRDNSDLPFLSTGYFRLWGGLIKCLNVFKVRGKKIRMSMKETGESHCVPPAFQQVRITCEAAADWRSMTLAASKRVSFEANNCRDRF